MTGTEGKITVVGIGADGMAGLSQASRRELLSATVIYGGPRQLDLLGGEITAERRAWPSPMVPALPTLFDGLADVHVVASGDPMLHGIGATLIRLFGRDRVTVLPHVSSVTLACARLGWSVQDTEVISLVTAAPHTAIRHGGRAVVLSKGSDTPRVLARLLDETGCGESRFTVLEQLGGPAERITTMAAAEWATDAPAVDALNVIAVHYLPERRVAAVLPDAAFGHDGQITKQTIRALALTALEPRPGHILWDVGSGSGSIAIEWCRASGGRAVAFERDEVRRERIANNATMFGVRVDVRGAAPDSFADVAAPDTVFIGGGLTQPGLFEACFDALEPGGRLVANAVTAESEAYVVQLYSRLGGDLRRFQHYHGEPIGRFTGWRPALPITQWTVVKK
ncbi:precorrin-6y C5,15-methyltransferase (decarboxylating) subunit CbiE [Mycolicibacterium aubagnense]|uniref:Precorrin-6Y-methylase n=1 Tax=Mycolicibacterium aubagnense TaxID=319707 RepID=A0ABM8HPP1_9MYCO|nr:precorrin-6y C5,15-methyltransferase (decarboxylating) subunit CbiE [Mycolicibacterium aubagnense]TLH60088.1 cobalamin biosynthesis bifunctional protein CbiET [Mycolicibacterium aubagnense]WGI34857.1 precorrin-6y C5,15-methyltransferase (decarboxylating) subunit CbiE [Mycolicibacterium aubagnense]BBX83242.1 precorrin-6Y-methylase [Mycolicibacterium aubagnense]